MTWIYRNTLTVLLQRYDCHEAFVARCAGFHWVWVDGHVLQMDGVPITEYKALYLRSSVTRRLIRLACTRQLDCELPWRPLGNATLGQMVGIVDEINSLETGALNWDRYFARTIFLASRLVGRLLPMHFISAFCVCVALILLVEH